ncbi:unnamed protein product [Euphydryas editha]|uniref:Centriolar and ciliogenesis-associated protein HYLS1 C-terminal domain-containing protein n=1 Tax=Euphydryas editha TaxID=104508 RepID=A0AAU9V7Q6_EUPED|nr:unnamed protein product [Euphydryas editha]
MDQDNYCEITSQLDAREILRYLNNLGIRNINAEVLKYFITDLKKLIKYDLQHKNEGESLSTRTQQSESVGLERLHSASTFSSRSRSKVPVINVTCNRGCQSKRKSTNLLNIHSAPTIGHQKEEIKPSRRSCSCVRLEKTEKKPVTSKEIPKSTVSSNLIKVPKQLIKRKNDPVSLYHYYTSLWEKYKPNVPGENNWSDLRWNIRQKMVGNVISQTSNKVQEKIEKDTSKKKIS